MNTYFGMLITCFTVFVLYLYPSFFLSFLIHFQLFFGYVYPCDKQGCCIRILSEFFFIPFQLSLGYVYPCDKQGCCIRVLYFFSCFSQLHKFIFNQASGAELTHMLKLGFQLRRDLIFFPNPLMKVIELKKILKKAS